MGVFDDIRCKYPLPADPKFQDRTYQTKDTPKQFLELYEIGADGILRLREPRRKGEPEVWTECLDFTDGIRFYGFVDDVKDAGWIEFSAYFVNGKLSQIHLVELREPEKDLLPERTE